MVFLGFRSDKVAHDISLRERPTIDQQPRTALGQLASQMLGGSFRLAGVR
jgi:hypothetical protein